MKVCFLNPPRYQERINNNFNICFNVSRFSRGVDIVYAITPPTELATLAAEVAKKHDVEILDANAENLLPREVFLWIKNQAPDFLVIKCGDTTLLDDLAYYYFADGIGIKTIVWEDILNPTFSKDLEKQYRLKRVLYGEPERKIFEFLEGKTGFIGGDIIKDIDSLPQPLMEKLPMEKYKNEGKRNWYSFLHRGCGWGKCEFCLMASTKIPLRTRSIDHIREELEMLKKYKIETIYFWDPQFNISKQRVIELTDLLKQYSFKYECWMRCDTVDEEIVKRMRNSGCFRFHLGLENGSQQILNSYNKGITIEQIIKAFKLAKKYKIETAAYLVLGTPEENKETFQETKKLIKRIKPTTIVPANFRPFPNVPLTKKMQKDGLLKMDHFSLAEFANCFGWTTASKTKYLNSDQLKKEIESFRKLSTRIAIKNYLLKPQRWSGLLKPFIIRTIRNFLKRKKS